MEQPETRRLSEAVEAGLRDGRTLDSLRKAMTDSGYGEGEIKSVLSGVDRRRISRKPQRRRLDMNWVAAAVVVVVLISFSSYLFLGGFGKGGGIQSETGVGIITNQTPQGLRICYVVNESIKQDMIDAGAKCDKWYLIKEI